VTIPATMRAVLLTGHGGHDKLELRDDVPVPVPGANDVLIRIGAAAVNNTDINTRTGWYAKSAAGAEGWSGIPYLFPRVQGADACGRIVAVGADIDPARIHERVMVEPAFRGSSKYDISYFGSEVDGAFADYARVPAAHAYQIESPLSDVELASFPCAYATAENILTRLDLAAGERVLVTGASGGVGSAAVQLARRRGAEVIAIANPDKAEAVRTLGASEVIPSNAPFEALLGQEEFDVAIDVVGGAQFGGILNSLKRGGRYGVSGAISGPVVNLDLRMLYLKDICLIGCTVLEPGVFANLIRYVEQGEIRPLIAATYPLAEIVAAQEAFLSKRHVGKIVLTL
jgi:NADPH:quinone reductase-like Zn-dependent oxidoreductase